MQNTATITICVWKLKLLRMETLPNSLVFLPIKLIFYQFWALIFTVKPFTPSANQMPDG